MLQHSHCIFLSHSLLNYDRIESGTFQIEHNPVDIWRIIKKTASEFSIQARNRKIAMEVTVATDQVDDSPGERDSVLGRLRVIGDDIRLTQAIRNLISNALKFSSSTHGKIIVTASYDPQGLPSLDRAIDDEYHIQDGSVKLAVKDNGVGLSESRLGLLFSEGVQFDANKLQAGGGSGLGLCITKEIVEQHRGTISVYSEGPGKGALFVIELPLFRTAPENDMKARKDLSHTPTTSTMGSSVSQSPRQRHILVVDDSLSNTKMLCRLLERAGHTYVVARDGQQAVEKYEATLEKGENAEMLDPFDTIVSDRS